LIPTSSTPPDGLYYRLNGSNLSRGSGTNCTLREGKQVAALAANGEF